MGMPSNEMVRLIYNGKSLIEENLCQDYSMTDNSTVHMILRFIGGRATRVHPLPCGPLPQTIIMSAATTSAAVTVSSSSSSMNAPLPSNGGRRVRKEIMNHSEKPTISGVSIEPIWPRVRSTDSTYQYHQVCIIMESCTDDSFH